MSVTISGSSPTFASGYQGGTITSGTTVSTTSGTSADFTNIPSWVKRITVMFYNVSTNGSSIPQIQLGTGGVPTTTGYNAMASLVSTTSNTTRGTTATSGFILSYSGSAAEAYHGSVVFTLLNNNIWTCAGLLLDVSAVGLCNQSGSIALAGTLNMVRVTTQNGTDAFDSGAINILYE